MSEPEPTVAADRLPDPAPVFECMTSRPCFRRLGDPCPYGLECRPVPAAVSPAEPPGPEEARRRAVPCTECGAAVGIACAATCRNYPSVSPAEPPGWTNVPAKPDEQTSASAGVAGMLVGRPKESGRATGTGVTEPTIPAADPSVSPADTIRPDDLRLSAEYVAATGDTATAANMLRSAAGLVDALLAVGERDKADLRNALHGKKLLELDLENECRILGELIAERERDKAEIAEWKAEAAKEYGELKAAHDLREAALASLEAILFGDARIRSRDELDARAEQLVKAVERDRQHIRDLTEALEEIADGTTPDRIGRYEYLRDWVHKTAARAVLAGEEDAAPATLERRVTVTICDDCSCQAKKVTGGWSCPCCGDGATVREATVTALVPVRAAGEEDTP